MTAEAQSPIVIHGEANKTIEVRLGTEKSMVWLAQRQAQRNLKHYIFDINIPVSYRINSLHAIRFHQWAIYILLKHLAQVWILNRQHIQTDAREREVRCI
ncbi:RhuM family protein [Nitrosomonas halophila]|uniref:Virulence protein RhuM family protein n=1 Tax=Nitrosomonas halophila TaxID=44576 RepID=A0A1H3KZW1_9PROT|nr:RhuM family protein [Nitrosomonas halophila]SDY57556.1 Virulence protein RhuM family protein [Nitrosomonas halophila]